MRNYLQAGWEKARRLRSDARERALERGAHHREYQSLLRELAELAFRTLRRRRYGDGRDMI